jgi:two-component system, LytTR family, sensor kinase
MKSFFQRIKLANYLTKAEVRRVLIHSVCWVGFLFYLQLLSLLGGVFSFNKILRVIIDYSPIIVIFYVNYHLLRIYAPLKKYQIIIAYTALMLMCYLGVRYFNKQYVYQWVGISETVYAYASNKFYIESIWIFFNFLIYSYCYWFAKNSLKLQREVFMEEQARTKAELSYLQAQINPHFLFNTLNFLYTEAVMVSDRMAQSMMALSNMMRYVVSETKQSPTEISLVSVEQEITHIESFIALQQLRFNNQLFIETTIEGRAIARYQTLPPLTLISFIDNAFKYGDLRDPLVPLKINIKLDNDNFYFSVQNKKETGPTESSTGIGLTNTQKRLQLVYKERQNILVSSTDVLFKVEIIVKNNY